MASHRTSNPRHAQLSLRGPVASRRTKAASGADIKLEKMLASLSLVFGPLNPRIVTLPSRPVTTVHDGHDAVRRGNVHGIGDVGGSGVSSVLEPSSQTVSSVFA